MRTYDFDLPETQIAREPVHPRDASRLLVLDRATGSVHLARMTQLPQFLRPGDLLVANQTRVLRARLRTALARTGREIEVLLAHPDGDGWVAMLGPSRRLRPDDLLLLQDAGEDASPCGFRLLESRGAGMWLLRPEGAIAAEMMARAGHLPLPPYLRRGDQAEDEEWYQTIFARSEGAIAAPTAGLHFSPELLDALRDGGMEIDTVTLHVGPGTFLPVRAESIDAHRVLPERFEVSAPTRERMRACRAAGGRVIAIGTTVTRALETAAGLSLGPDQAAVGWTDLTVTPGYRFTAIDGLVTNFHLPRSSLLLLVAAFAGRERVLSAYTAAIAAGFRFYSYGDAMLTV
ncbi:MAG: tRNA preQ1(34) S-adenosylmethionine ribosyltransferase-isomerase QueA [Candidatus Eisenbacteria bacterium]|nr:tRNA preQ1(34) S-adenosylmethionine ribosyltransferase-isomerase QueA [Candidatus Eisenbacteria bacterium]